MKTSTLLFILVTLLLSCQQTNTKNATTDSLHVPSDSIKTEPIKENKLAPLTNEEITVPDKNFGDVVELAGVSHPVDQFFKIGECEMIALDTILIVKNMCNNNMFTAYSLPDFRFIKSFGRMGKGPGELSFYVSLVKDESKTYICYILEKSNSHLYALNKNLELKDLALELKKSENKFNERQLYSITPDNFLYVESTKKGKSIFQYLSLNDSTTTSEIKDLAFNKKYKSWAAYIGDFGVNGEKNRAVYAYKYFKRLMFLDLENNTTKTVQFDVQENKSKSNEASTLLAPSNVTHYWGMSPQKKYVYVLYSGRTPIEVSKEFKTSSGYIFVEQFDWNGNLIAKYKLDHWGYFCVNEQENTIYLASVTDEQPFYSYQLNSEQ